MHPKRQYLDGRDEETPKSVFDSAQEALRDYTPPVSDTDKRINGYRSTRKADADTRRYWLGKIYQQLEDAKPKEGKDDDRAPF